MNPEIPKYIGWAVAIITFFVGRYIKNIDKKIADNEKKIDSNVLEISRMDEKEKALKEANEKASLELKKEMSILAKDMSDSSKAISRLSNITGLHDLRIANTEEKVTLMANEIVAIKKGK